jgi:hypothetical protein
MPRQPCGEEDYFFHWTPCINDVRDKVYKWNQPQICSSVTGVPLPDPVTDKECEPCNPGHYHEIVDATTQ